MARVLCRYAISNALVVQSCLGPKMFTALTLMAEGAPLKINPKRFDVDDLGDDEIEFLGDITSYDYPEWDCTFYEWESNG